MQKIILALITIYFFYLMIERILLTTKRKKIKYIIHVNGIRGKSTVTRLIDSGLRESEYKVFTKITGTAPRIINTFGEEFQILRQGKANINEQKKIIKMAVKEGADILVIECMAVKPEFQSICENKYLKANIGVITNVREDHLDEMGETLDEIADSLSLTIPSSGVLFTSEKKYLKIFKEKAKLKNSELIPLIEEKEEYLEVDFPSNVALSLSVCKYLGVDEEKAFKRMKNYRRDPGSLKIFRYRNTRGKNIYLANALAANDPNSSQIILEMILEKKIQVDEKYLLVNNRSDRLKRWEQFIEFSRKNIIYFDRLIISGELKKLFKKYLLKTNVAIEKIDILEGIEYFEKLEKDSLIIAVGNICGKGQKIVNFFQKKGEVVNDK